MKKKLLIISLFLCLPFLGFSEELVDIPLKMTPGDQCVFIDWEHYDSPEIVGYNIYRDRIKINEELITSNSYLDTELVNCVRYTYSIRAILKSGQVLWDNSVIATVPYKDGEIYYFKGDTNLSYHFKAGSIYVIEEDFNLKNEWASLMIDEGVVVKFKKGAKLIATSSFNKIFLSSSKSSAPIIFTSYKDDEHGGDTNGDGDLTKPQAGDWNTIQVPLGLTKYNGMPYCKVLYATTGYTFPEVGDNEISHWSFENCINAIAFESTTISNTKFNDNDIINCTNFINGEPGTNFSAANNWFGDITGPYNASLNPDGKGCIIPEGIPFRPYSILPYITPYLEAKILDKEFLEDQADIINIDLNTIFTRPLNFDFQLGYSVEVDGEGISAKTENNTLIVNTLENKNGGNTVSIRANTNYYSSDKGYFTDYSFNINLTPVNDAPTAIALSNKAIDENKAIGTEIGTLTASDVDANQTFTYTIAENENFEIVNDKVVSKRVFDFESDASSYDVDITVTDQDALAYTQKLTINISDVNEAPTDITLSNNIWVENTPEGTLIGILSAEDPDANQTFTFTTIQPEFEIIGNQIFVKIPLDRESYHVNTGGQGMQIAVKDQDGLVFGKFFAMRFKDINETPTDIQLSNITITENTSIGTVLGKLSTTDEDYREDFTYTIKENEFFEIDKDNIIIKGALNFEENENIETQITVTDKGGLVFTKSFTITIENINEAPNLLELSNNNIDENTVIGTVVGVLTTVDEDYNQTFTYSIVENEFFEIEGDKLQLKSALNCGQDPIINIQITVKDQDNLSFEKEFTIRVNDVSAPVLPILSDITAECSVAVIPPVALYDCAAEITGTTTDPLTYDIQGEYVINWTYDDGNGFISTQTQNVIIDDVSAPVLPILPDITAECSVTVIPPLAVDACAGEITGTTTDPLFYDVQGEYVINWTYNDGNGNTGTQTQNILIDDISLPFMEFPEVTIDFELPTNILSTGFVNGLCVVDDTVYFAEYQTGKIGMFSLSDPVGTLNYIYNSVQGIGEGIYDITHWNNALYFSTSGGKKIRKISLSNYEVVDVLVSEGKIWELAIHNMELYFGHGGKISKFDLTKENPIIEDVVLNVDAMIMGMAFVNDYLYFSEYQIGLVSKVNLTENLPISVSEDVVHRQSPGTLLSIENMLFIGGSPTLSLYNTINDEISQVDTSGMILNVHGIDTDKNVLYTNSTSGQFYLTPYIVTKLPYQFETITYECQITQADITIPTLQDNCAGEITGTTNFDFSQSQNEGSYEITWSFDDGNGNITTKIQHLIIDDITAPIPELEILADVTAECEVKVLDAPTATDNCGGEILVSHNATLPILGDGTTTEVIWTYDDQRGNITAQTQQVIIKDTTNPVVDLDKLPTIEEECKVSELTAPTATDNCTGTITGTYDVILPLTGNGTSHAVTWTFDDGNGNITRQGQVVLIKDITAPIPELEVLADVIVECEITDLETPFVNDNCVDKVIITNDVVLPITEQGTTIVTWTYDDGNGNTSTQAQNIIIDDVTAPRSEIEILDDVLAVCEVSVLETPFATDNCALEITITNNAELPISQQGTTVITWSYDDGNGNIAKQTQKVIITDTEKPIVDTTDLETIYAECEVTSLEAPTATDNCTGTITGTHNVTFPITGNGTTTEIIWTFDDGNGNSTTQTQFVIIEDVSAPEPDDYLENITGLFDVNLNPPTAMDNCIGEVIATTTNLVHYNEIGTFTTTWVFDDGHGNISTQTQTVIIGASVESHGFSPNDDGINDHWTIDGIETYPKCKVQVYSRSGTKVYEKVGYKNTWDGYSNTGSNKKMMSGAYYYIIEFNKNGLKPKSGWVYINY